MANLGSSQRALRRLANTANHACRTTTPFQRRLLHNPPPPPLYLDFLAPSWHHPPIQLSRPRHSSVAPQPLRSSKRLLSSTPCRNATAIQNPRKDDSGEEMTITITPRAAHRLHAIATKDGNPGLALRVAVESGGCHGFQYLMSLVNTSEIDGEEDTLFEDEGSAKRDEGDGGYRPKVVMDEASLELLKGSSIDYTMELIGSQFKVVGIPGATSSCGCGTSFDIA